MNVVLKLFVILRWELECFDANATRHVREAHSATHHVFRFVAHDLRKVARELLDINRCVDCQFAVFQLPIILVTVTSNHPSIDLGDVFGAFATERPKMDSSGRTHQ